MGNNSQKKAAKRAEKLSIRSDYRLASATICQEYYDLCVRDIKTPSDTKLVKVGIFRDIVPGVTAFGIVWCLWTVAMNPIFNFFGNVPEMLYISSIATCLFVVLLSFAAVHYFHWMKIFYWISVGMCILILSSTCRFVSENNLSHTVLESVHAKDHNFLTKNLNAAVNGIDFIQRQASSISFFGGLEFRENVDNAILNVGGFKFPVSSQGVIPLGGQDGFKIRAYRENGRLFCDLKFFIHSQSPPIELNHRVLTGRPEGFDFNFDNRAAELVNANLVPIFQMYWKTENEIVLNGIFPSGGYIVLCNEEHLEVVAMRDIDKKYPGGFIPFNIRKLFKYPSWKRQGQRDEP